MLNKILVLCCILPAVVLCSIDRPRGVPASKASFYKAGETFSCITGGRTIPFEYINDDYCDCEDGSDEPGTSACPMMKYYCENKGHKPEFILSSRVNDGICDCCDGSDEYDGDKIQCQDFCDEIGQLDREKKEKEMKLHEDGYKVKLTYIQEGQAIQQQKKTRLIEVEKELEDLAAIKADLEEKKNVAEIPEKEAKDKHEKAWEEVKTQRKMEKERETALMAFDEIDSNDDQHVELNEMLAHPEFDIDSDGNVSHEEAKEYLEELERAGQDVFIEKIWPNIKEIFKSKRVVEEPKGDSKDSESPNGDIDTPTEDKKTETTPPPTEEKEDEDKMPEYDEETKQLIADAEHFRNQFNDADKNVRDTENEISNIKTHLDLDFGPQFEYGILKGQCFEMTDREYTYKLCPFEKASQKSKSGGSETNLGLWGHWQGSNSDKYSSMKYEKGQNCWNGPDRSVQVVLQCGTENVILSASEPSRCEYRFDFATPARCEDPSKQKATKDPHDEL